MKVRIENVAGRELGTYDVQEHPMPANAAAHLMVTDAGYANATPPRRTPFNLPNFTMWMFPTSV